MDDIYRKKLPKIRSKRGAKDLLWKIFENDTEKIRYRPKIAMLNGSCYGFGDIVFTYKLSKYLVEWYDAEVTIFTNNKDGYLSLGMDSGSIVYPRNNVPISECGSVDVFVFNKRNTNKKYDLYFISPYIPEENIKMSSFKHAGYTNTFVFSEYNPYNKTEYDFETGVGGKRLGMLFTEPPLSYKRNIALKNHYVFAYIGNHSPYDDYMDCAMKFIEMVCEKYKNVYKNLDIVVPQWMLFMKNDETVYQGKIFSKKTLLKKIGTTYDVVLFKTKDGGTRRIDNNDVYYDICSTLDHASSDDRDCRDGQHNRSGIQSGNRSGNRSNTVCVGNTRSSASVLTFRFDILPVNNTEMKSLMKFSEDFILLTGDQSVTDAISCCDNKTIFYQKMFWKVNFAKKMGEILSNKYLPTKNSCGSMTAINIDINSSKLLKEWDFRKLARPKMDAIVRSRYYINHNKALEDIDHIINSSRNIRSIKNKIL
jgi:hypothetical protein